MSNPQISQLEAQLAALQEKLNTFEEERQLHHLIQDYPYYHDLCYGKGAGPEQYAQWESLFTPDGVSNLHPIGSHQGRDGKMAWAQSATGRGKGCQITISSARVIFDPSKPTEAAGRAYAHIEMVLDDGTVFAVKGRYTWIFSKVDDAWKVASVTLAPFPEA